MIKFWSNMASRGVLTVNFCPIFVVIKMSNLIAANIWIIPWEGALGPISQGGYLTGWPLLGDIRYSLAWCRMRVTGCWVWGSHPQLATQQAGILLLDHATAGYRSAPLSYNFFFFGMTKILWDFHFFVYSVEILHLTITKNFNIYL